MIPRTGDGGTSCSEMKPLYSTTLKPSMGFGKLQVANNDSEEMYDQSLFLS